MNTSETIVLIRDTACSSFNYIRFTRNPDKKQISCVPTLTHSNTITPFDAPGKQAF